MIKISKAVQEALDNGKPIVALESTIISHGMPYPENVQTARNVENIIKELGAVPATICIMDGFLKVGLTDDELELLGKAEGVIKTSRRDIPIVLAKKAYGATTVSATMIIAELAGIKVFVTGGIGGVHRGSEDTMDISADLDELSRTSVAVVCAGIKSILDLGLTLEYLETKGVPVLSYGTKELPAFYTRTSGFEVDYKVDTPNEFAVIMKNKWDLGMNGGIVIANPIPLKYSMPLEVINEAIDEALSELDQKGIKGKESTPFLLSKIKDITKGNSLASNIQLIYNNARLGAKIAVE